MSNFESTKAVLMDLLAEHGDEAQVEVLRNLDAAARMWRGRSTLWVAVKAAERGTEAWCQDCRCYVSERAGSDDDYNEPHDLNCPTLAALMVLDPEETAEVEFRRAWHDAHEEQARRNRPPVPMVNPYANSVSTLNGLFREVYGEALPSLAHIRASDLSFHSDPPPPQSPLRFTKPNPAAESYEATLEHARRFLDAGLISDQQFTNIVAGRSPLRTEAGLVIADKMPKPR